MARVDVSRFVGGARRHGEVDVSRFVGGARRHGSSVGRVVSARQRHSNAHSEHVTTVVVPRATGTRRARRSEGATRVTESGVRPGETDRTNATESERAERASFFNKFIDSIFIVRRTLTISVLACCFFRMKKQQSRRGCFFKMKKLELRPFTSLPACFNFVETALSIRGVPQ